MITIAEIENIIANLPEAQEKAREMAELARLTLTTSLPELRKRNCDLEQEFRRIREELANARNRIVDVERERDIWMRTTSLHVDNEQFYHGLLHRCADLLGEECRVCDDGSVIPEGAFLALKVPEVLAKRLEALYPQSRQIELATTECCQMARRIAELEEILKATRLVAARNRDVRKRDVEELEKACLSKDKVIDDKNAHIRDLEAEAARLHKLWHEAEHKLTQIKALTEPPQDANPPAL